MPCACAYVYFLVEKDNNMKTLFKSVMAMMLIVMLFGACEMGKDEDPNKGENSYIDYTNYPESQAAFFVTNTTSQKLVAFKGSLSEQYKIGGIPVSQSNHGLRNNPDLFITTQDFPVILLTEKQYLDNRNNPASLLALETAPFTKLYVFFNKSGENRNTYQISNKLGGTYILKVTNPSNLNVELRVGGLRGPTLGYAPAGMGITNLYVDQGDLDVFPVFKYYNKLRDILETIYPKDVENEAWFRSFQFDVGVGPQMLNIRDALGQIKDRTSGAAYLIINNASAAAIRLLQGTNIVTTTTNTSYWNSGSTKEFQINMPVIGSASFGDTQTIFNYMVGPRSKEVEIKSVEGTNTLIFKKDMMYTVNVTGDSTLGTLKAEVELREGSPGGPTPVKFDDFVMN